MTPENRVKAEVLKYLKLRQIKAWSNPSGAVRIRPGKFMSFGLKGSSDILGLLPGGRFLAVECKANCDALDMDYTAVREKVAALYRCFLEETGDREKVPWKLHCRRKKMQIC